MSAMNAKKSCYLCSSSDVKFSIKRRPVDFHGVKFFFQCNYCKAYSLWPKLTEFEVQELYSIDYIDEVKPHFDDVDNDDRYRKLKQCLESIDTPEEKKYLDYGCGADATSVKLAKSLGFESIGVEVVRETRTLAGRNSECKILSPEELIDSHYKFDIIFIGDVLEHLSEPKKLLIQLNTQLKPNGVILTQGPLEGSLTVLNFFVAFKAVLQRKASVFPPYHVSLANKKAIRSLFQSCGLRIKHLEISEPIWPASILGSKESFSSIGSFASSVLKQLDVNIHRARKGYGTRFFAVLAKN